MSETCNNCLDEIKDCDCGETEGFSTDGPVCPHCGYLADADGSETSMYTDGDSEYHCGDCGAKYSMDVYVSHSWTTTKLSV